MGLRRDAGLVLLPACPVPSNALRIGLNVIVAG
jgi:hypothetical protein